MELDWRIDDSDIKRVQKIVCKYKDDAFVRFRKRRNLADNKPAVDKAEFWQQMVGMRLTSIQRTGPDSYVAKFLRTKPFPLNYEVVRDNKGKAAFMAAVLEAHKGIRFYNAIGRDLATNYQSLETGGGWEKALATVNQLRTFQDKKTEREIARYFRKLLRGFGPKQARNFLQSLGLTRYEIPLDSRITKWLNDFGFPVRLNGAGLADRDYYEFVLDGIQALCSASKVLPCMFDAAVFASFDNGKWTEENVIP